MGTICALGLVLAACEATPEGDSKSGARAGAAEPAGTTAGRSDYYREGPKAGRAPTELGAVPRGAAGVEQRSSSGLDGPEYYRGTGVLARDPGGARVKVGLGENGRVTLNFANAEIRDVIDIVLGDTLSLNYIVDPAVQGTVTVRTSEPLDRDAVIPALENILSLNGVALTLVNNTYMIVPRDVAAQGFASPAVSPTESQLARGFGISIIPLNYASVSSIQEILQPFIGAGTLRIDEARNLLIYAGSGRNTRDLMELVEVFDIDWMRGMSFALFPVEVADVKSLVTDLEAVFLQDGKSPLAGVLRFVPIERLNAVLTISPQPAYLDRAETWIQRLDRGAEGAGRRIFVYYVENGRSEDLAEILSQVFDVSSTGERVPPPSALAPGLTPVELASRTPDTFQSDLHPAGNGEAAEGAEPAPQPARPYPQPIRQTGAGQAVASLVEGLGDIRIIADEANNALVVLATAAEYRMIEATLKKLDIIPLQVLIEATIAEVTLNDTLQYGVQWFLESGNFNVQFLEAAVTPLFPLAGKVPGFSTLFNAGNKAAVINALSDVTDIKVVSSPSLMVLDNQSARLQVGDQVPFQTGTTVGETTTTSVQQIDTGVVLEVTPRVNAGGLVTLEISQEVSNSIPTAGGTATQPTIQQRKIETTVAVQSGETIALGGLIRDDNSDSVIGIPILSQIPILGNLFKTTSNITLRTELLVLITPRVVRNQVDARKVTEELRRRLKSIEPLEQKIRQTDKPET